MANQTVYPYGTNGSLPSSVGIINDRTTGGADKAWSAEQGKIVSQQADKNTEDIFEMNSRSIPPTKYDARTGWFINSSNTWSQVSSNPTNYAYRLIPITPGERYVAYGLTYIALLKSSSRSSGASPDFCEGYAGRIYIASGSTYDFIAPEDAVYLYFLTKYNGTDYNGTLRTSPASYVEAITSLSDEVVSINSKKVDISTLNRISGWIIDSSGKWGKPTPSSNYSIVFIPIEAGKDYIVFAGTTDALIALLTSTSRTDGSQASFCEGYNGRIRVWSGRYYSFTAPADAQYLYMCLMSSGVAFDSWLSIPQPISEQVADLGGGEDETHLDAFNTAPEYYAWLKMEQATKLKWTPKKNTIQKASSTQKFATSEQTGFPYSSVSEWDKRLGTDVSIHTFMTAINNPYSVMYTECVRAGYSQSAYGITYYGAQNTGPYYGMVCSGLADYSLGMVIPWLTNDLYVDMVTEHGLSEIVYDQSANGVRRGDMLCDSGHTRIVKDVWRKNGVVTNVLVSETIQPLTLDNSIRTAEQFNSYLSTNGITIARYKELYKNIHYEPSPYVAVGDETPQTVTYNNDICCFAGDKAAFIEGDIIYIHCLNLAYPQMELYKNDTLVETITLASEPRAALTSDSLAYAVNLSNDNLGYGMYKCRLKDGDTYSDYTYFEVINASVTLSDGTATYASANAAAVCWYWQRYHNSQGANIWDINPLNGESSGTFTTTRPDANFPLLKVLFKGNYGRVAARYLEQ